MYAALVFSGSNGGLLMGTVELIILLVAYTVWAGKGRKAWVSRGICISILAVGGIAAVMLLPKLLEKMGVTDLRNTGVSEILHAVWDKLITSNNARMDLLKRMLSDFKHNPIFGVGIGYTGNSDIYSPVKGAMNWYHMWFAQVIGGLGIVGILAYGYQLVDRVRIFFANRNSIHMTCFLSYVGLFLMSQVNPGEFCPVPYAMLAVTYFVMMEKPEDDRLLFGHNQLGRASVHN